MIHFACPACGHQLKARPDFAGRKAKCSKCARVVTVPGSSASAPSGPQKDFSFTPEPTQQETWRRSRLRPFILAAEFGLGLSLIGGLAGDFFRPIEAINFYALAICGGFASLLLIFSFKRLFIAATCLFFTCLTLGFGSWWALAEFKGGKQKGFLADHIGVVQRLQAPAIARLTRSGAKQSRQTAEQDAEVAASAAPAPPGGRTGNSPDDSADSASNSARDENDVGTTAGNSAKPIKAERSDTRTAAKNASPKSADGTTDVIAEGLGATPDDALKDAFRNAVRQVVGAVVDAETLVKNDDIIVDQVLTYSDGFIKTYDELRKSQDKSLVRLKIRAQVARRKVIAKLKAAKVSVKEVDGKGLFAEAITQLDAEKDGEALLRKAFDGFPRNYLKASVLGKPKLIDKSEQKATVEIQVQVEADQDSYKAFAKRLSSVLDQTSSKKGEFLLNYNEQNENGSSPQSVGDTNRFQERCLVPTTGRWWHYQLINVLSQGTVERCQNTECATILLCTRNTKNCDRLEFRYYVLDKPLQALVAKACSPMLDRQFGQYAHPCRAKLTLEDQSGATITTERFALHDGQWSLQFGTGAINIFVISPTFQKGNNDMAQKPQLVVARRISLSLEELKSIESAKVELEGDNSGEAYRSPVKKAETRQVR